MQTRVSRKAVMMAPFKHLQLPCILCLAMQHPAQHLAMQRVVTLQFHMLLQIRM
jgi:hypothetical protein